MPPMRLTAKDGSPFYVRILGVELSQVQRRVERQGPRQFEVYVDYPQYHWAYQMFTSEAKNADAAVADVLQQIERDMETIRARYEGED